MRRFILLAFLLLAGCWTGEGLYSNSDAHQPIPAGAYRATNPDGQVRVETVTLLPDGMTRIGDNEGKGVYGFAPLDHDNRRFVAWYQAENAGPEDHGQLYLLLERRSDDEFLMEFPSCDGEAADVARRAGATVKTGSVAECQFPTKAAVEGALRQLPMTDDAMKMVRIR
jgi:hypothetical protein